MAVFRGLLRVRIDLRALMHDDCAPSLRAIIDDHAPRAGSRSSGFVSRLRYERSFGSSHARLAELIPFAARLALECIGNSDALYHNVEHTMLVTLAGHEIFKGRALLKPSTPADYSNF